MLSIRGKAFLLHAMLATLVAWLAGCAKPPVVVVVSDNPAVRQQYQPGNAPVAAAVETGMREATATGDATPPSAVSAPAENLTPIFHQLARERTEFEVGEDNSGAVWVFCTKSVALPPGRTQEEALQMAELRAKEAIAQFIGQTISGERTLVTQTVQENGQSHLRKELKSIRKINVDQFLRGVTLFQSQTAEGRVYASFVSSSRAADAAERFARQLERMPPDTVKAAGFCLIERNGIPEARKGAARAALRNAVEQVMGTMVVGQGKMLDNDKVRSKLVNHTLGNVKQYRVAKEAKVDDSYMVIVLAKVDKETVLDNYAAVIRSMGDPGFYIRCDDPDLATALKGFWQELGLRLAPSAAKADFLVEVKGRYIPLEDEHYGVGIQTDVTLEVLSAKNRQPLLSMSNDPRQTANFFGSFHQIRQGSAKRAFQHLKKPLHRKLNDLLMEWLLNGRPVTVEYRGVGGDARQIEALRKAIDAVPDASVLDSTYQESVAVFQCRFVGSTDEFVYFLQERLTQGAGRLPACQLQEYNHERVLFSIR